MTDQISKSADHRERAKQALMRSLSELSRGDAGKPQPTPTNPADKDRGEMGIRSGNGKGSLIKTIGDGTGIVSGGIGDTMAGIKIINDRAKAVADAQKGSFPTPYAVAPEFEKMVDVYLDALEADEA